MINYRAKSVEESAMSIHIGTRDSIYFYLIHGLHLLDGV
jgi:hypothetical protein